MGQVLVNCALRDTHPTLDNSDLPNAFAVVMMFLNLNKNCTKFDEAFLAKGGLDDFIKIPMVCEQDFMQ